MNIEKLFVYDIETYPNVFTLTIADMNKRTMKTFEISKRRDQRKQMFEYLRGLVKSNSFMVGFNNLGFDYPVLHYILKNQNCSVIQIYNKAMEIINYSGFNRFAFQIADRDILINQIDLYRIHHYDNQAKSTSLKALEFAMRMENIEDLPYKVGSWLEDDQIDTLIKYNKHDVKATVLFLERSYKELDFRFGLVEKTKSFSVLNYNDTKIGKNHFINELEKANRGCCYEVIDGKRHRKQTKRPYIHLKECIFNYVNYERSEFNAVLDWLRNRTITETKGVFSDIPEHKLGDVAKYAVLTTIRKKIKHDNEIEQYQKQFPLGWIEEVPLKSKVKGVQQFSKYFNYKIATTLNVVINNLVYVFGTGGIHASVESQIVLAEDGYIIVDQDVSSYYPNLAIKNRVYPEHLGEQFCNIYEGLYLQRKQFDKKSVENAMLKLALNGTYGASNDEHSPLYDPKFTMQITINGQLSLCMLAEQLLKIEGLQIIQCNTDGLTYKCRKEDDERAQSICNNWCNTTKLELERADYSKMAIRDVNNYIAIKTNGDVKLKGAYEWKDKPLHKNHSNAVIGQAVEAFIVKGIPIEETIYANKDPYDFMARTKVPRSSRAVLMYEDGTTEDTQNTCRYYPSKTGATLLKIMPPLPIGKTVWDCINPDGEVERVDTKGKMETRKKKGWKIIDVILPPEERVFNILKDQNVRICNDMKTFKGWDDLNYQWYIDEAYKLASLNKDEDKDVIEGENNNDD